MKRLVLFLVLACAAAPAAAPAAGTILNTLQGNGEDEPGWSGGLEGLFTGKGGNTESIQVAAGGRVPWRGGPDRLRLQASLGYEESGREVIARNTVVHARHNREFGGRWATVAFVQGQTNPFRRLQSRWLFGAGLRRDLLDDDRGLLAVGATPMLERERVEGAADHTARGRLSVFLHASRELSGTARLDAVAFWQPLFSDAGDFRSSATLTLVVQVTGSVDLKVGGSVEDDSRPPAGVERTDWTSFAGFGVGF